MGFYLHAYHERNWLISKHWLMCLHIIPATAKKKKKEKKTYVEIS